MLVPFLTCSLKLLCLRPGKAWREIYCAFSSQPQESHDGISSPFLIASRTALIPHFLLNMLEIRFHALDFFAYILLMFLENGNHLVNISRDIILKPEKLLNPRNRKTGALEAEELRSCS